MSGLLTDYHEAYREVASPRCAKCGWLVLIPDKGVDLMRRRGRCHFDNVMRCGLIWECPTCGAFLKAERAEEAEKAKAWHVAQFGEDSAVMITLTVRHGIGDDLRAIRRGVAKAWERFIQGREWIAWKARLGGLRSLRALEVTWGPQHGWHPHLHVAAFFETAPPPEFQHDVFTRWRACVVAVLGEANAPLEVAASGDPVGVVVTPLNRVNYLAKLGLEISAPNTKAAHEGHYTPLDMLALFAETGELEWRDRYKVYATAMRGARQLTWSRGFKAAAGIVDRTDEEIVAGTDEQDEHVTHIASADFALLRRVRGASASVKELGELYGKTAVDQFIRHLTNEYSDEVRKILRERGLG